MIVWFKKTAVLVIVVAALVFLWRGLMVLAAVVVALVVVALGFDRWRKWRAIRRFRSKWGAQG